MKNKIFMWMSMLLYAVVAIFLCNSLWPLNLIALMPACFLGYQLKYMSATKAEDFLFNRVCKLEELGAATEHLIETQETYIEALKRSLEFYTGQKNKFKPSNDMN